MEARRGDNKENITHIHEITPKIEETKDEGMINVEL